MLKLVKYEQNTQQLLQAKKYGTDAYDYHCQLIEGYLKSHRVRNHSKRTISKNKKFLYSWFEYHGNENRPLLVWEAMEPVTGRQRIVNYGQLLLDSQISNQTIRNYLGMLKGFFSYVLAHPFVETKNGHERLIDLFNRIDQPVSEYDIPSHSHDSQHLGIPIEPERIYDFLSVIRQHYITQGHYPVLNARNYAMVVLAVETGLRVDELINLDMEKDIFFESKKLQTRYAKGSTGSGKKARVTVFPPLARDTLKYYLKEHRPKLKGAKSSTLLFLSRTGKKVPYAQVQRFIKDMIRVSNKYDVPVADHFGPHWLRRIFATRFIEKFPSKLPVLIQLLGHSGPATVHHYIRHSAAWTEKEIQNVLEKVAIDDDPMES